MANSINIHDRLLENIEAITGEYISASTPEAKVKLIMCAAKTAWLVWMNRFRQMWLIFCIIF